MEKWIFEAVGRCMALILKNFGYTTQNSLIVVNSVRLLLVISIKMCTILTMFK